MSANESKRISNATQLSPGRTYRVIAEFRDYDGRLHKVGESWRFLGHNFLPYEDGLTLSIEKNASNIVIRMQWLPESQEAIIDHFSDFVEEV